MDTNPNPVTGWTRLYHPAGVQVTLPVPLEAPISPEVAQMALTSISNLLAAGWLVNEPGLEDGEVKQEIGFVIRQAGNESPLMALYARHPKLAHRFLPLYLDTPEDLAAFEKASGLRVAELKRYTAKAAPDKDTEDFAAFAVEVNFSVVVATTEAWKRWNAAGETKGEPKKREVVRYILPSGEIIVPGQVTPTPQTAPATPKPAPIVRRYADGAEVIAAAYEAYDAYLAQRKEAPKSAEGLRAWFTVPSNKALVNSPRNGSGSPQSTAG